MKVTIITAVYNGAASIADTIGSVAQQDHDDLEHIVIDGASTDNTLARIAANPGRVSRVVSERDGGVYDAFNKGLRHATGDVVAFLNCGDSYVSRDVVSLMVREMSVRAVQAVFADVLIVKQDSPGRVFRRYSSRLFSPGRMAMGFMPAHPTLFMRRATYLAVGEYNPGFRIAGDFELCLRAFVRDKISYHYVGQPLVRMPNGGLSNRGWRSKLEITREMHRACALNGVRTSVFRLCLRFPIKMLEFI